MQHKQKFIIWATVFISAISLSSYLVDKNIFPLRQVNKIIQIPDSGPLGSGQLYNVQKAVVEVNPWDQVIKMSLTLLVVFAYWKILGLFIPGRGARVVAFLIGFIIVMAIIGSIAQQQGFQVFKL